jgi:hypothetical protein
MDYTIFQIGGVYQDSYLIFREGFTDFDKFDTPQRGYRSGVYLKHQGKCFPLFFYSPCCLVQDLETSMKVGDNYIAEYGIVVINDVTLENMLKTTHILLDSHYFKKQKPYTEEEIRRLLDPFDKSSY